MSVKEMIDRLPEPSTPEEMLIYNFVKGKEIYPASSLMKSRDKYLEVLLAFLKEKMHSKPPSAKKKAEG